MIAPVSEFTIRAATEADADAVDRVLQASYPALLAGDYDPELLAQVMPGFTRSQPHLLRSGTFYLAVDAQGIVRACGGWTAQRPGGVEERGEVDIEDNLAHLRHFGTDPAFTRRGLARALVERCLSEAEADGRTRFECYSTLSAVPFYEALGFVAVSEERVDVGGGLEFPSVFMRRG